MLWQWKPAIHCISSMWQNKVYWRMVSSAVTAKIVTCFVNMFLMATHSKGQTHSLWSDEKWVCKPFEMDTINSWMAAESLWTDEVKHLNDCREFLNRCSCSNSLGYPIKKNSAIWTAWVICQQQQQFERLDLSVLQPLSCLTWSVQIFSTPVQLFDYTNLNILYGLWMFSQSNSKWSFHSLHHQVAQENRAP